ncbi:DUF475 domain-containing protein [Massilia sp. TS11]|uniref:DUF475 domain-containing protein n=1 Tax=Massilia sp. TS11 TaxID=2908003 RepID=UPI001ED9E0AB|nr:DUF475 domain-containing protein [Massilia sp. TS11]MCG2586169.1 DUF475 domain-containing protein [Massilia sp. TS11]
MKSFRLSIVFTVLMLAAAALWGWHKGGQGGALQAAWIACVLGVLEVSLSFDNAVVNATVLKRWDAFWKKLFLTIGILVAVFGMRLLFPLLIVAIATNLSLAEVWTMAATAPAEYARQLSAHHDEVAAFGGAFLLLVFLNFLFDEDKELHWLGRIEAELGEHGNAALATTLALGAAFGGMALAEGGQELPVFAAGVVGVLVYVAVDWASGLLGGGGKLAVQGSLGGFLYLEVLDASFSFDGVIGAFAISNDVVIIMLGLAIGAMFVRSLTVYLVEQGTLDEYVFLEHGAHYAIGILALIMFISIRHEIPEWITGLSGVAFIGVSLWSSVRYRARRAHATGAPGGGEAD